MGKVGHALTYNVLFEEAASKGVPTPACVRRLLLALASGYAPYCGEKVARAPQREATIGAAAALVARLCSLSGALRPFRLS